MSYLNVYLANYYLEEQSKKKKRRVRRETLKNSTTLNFKDLTSKNAQTRNNNLEVNL